MEELSQDLIFHDNFWQNIKSFSKQNSKLRIHSKLDRNQSKLTVCNGDQLVNLATAETVSLPGKPANTANFAVPVIERDLARLVSLWVIQKLS